MIKILIAVALLCGAVFVGPRLADSQGFVHIATNSYIVESSLTTAIIILFVAFFVLHVVVNIISRSIKLPKSTARFFSNRKNIKHQTLQNEAFLAYEEGAYARALALIKKSGSEDELPINVLFLGAKSAFELGDLEKCRAFLNRAEHASDGSDIACKLLRAKLNLKIGNNEAALENLEALKKENYSGAVTTKLLYECYEYEGKFDKIYSLLPALKKQRIIDDDEAAKITARCTSHFLSTADTLDKVNVMIGSLDRAERHNACIMAPVVSKLVELGDVAQASKYTMDIIRRNLDPAILESIATWDAASPKVLEELTKQGGSNTIGSSTNVPLLKALANLEMKSDKLTEAKAHLKQALEHTKSRDLYLLAAELNERLSRHEEATKFFALALKAK